MKLSTSNCTIKIYLKQLIVIIPAIIFGIIFFSSCEEKTVYEKRLETELNKNIRVDSLFLGYKFGMTTANFFDHSWNLNKQEIVTGQRTIHYSLNELKSPASMEFYPQFKDDKIYSMPVEVHYNGWAPWNRDLFSDSLMADLVDLYEEKYNSDFFRSIHPESQKEAFIDIQGNRRISIFKRDDRIVTVEFLDLSTTESNI